MALMYVLVTYDIAHEKRLRRIATVMEDYGTRVQRSVFECLIEEDQLDELRDELSERIEPGEDSIRLYRICQACRERIQIYGLGSVTSDPDIYLY